MCHSNFESDAQLQNHPFICSALGSFESMVHHHASSVPQNPSEFGQASVLILVHHWGKEPKESTEHLHLEDTLGCEKAKQIHWDLASRPSFSFISHSGTSYLYHIHPRFPAISTTTTWSYFTHPAPKVEKKPLTSDIDNKDISDNIRLPYRKEHWVFNLLKYIQSFKNYLLDSSKQCARYWCWGHKNKQDRSLCIYSSLGPEGASTIFSCSSSLEARLSVRTGQLYYCREKVA